MKKYGKSKKSSTLKPAPINIRVGFGYDIHIFTSGRKLVLGGVEIPYSFGLLGHSDADVLLHAICDAILGAAALGDIGKHFPNTDKKFKGISSLILLKHVVKKIAVKKFSIINIDSTVVAEQPKISKYIHLMANTISPVLEIPPACINIKATTAEGLGAVGRKEGIAAYATALLCSS
ncbi:2-C-methyl-D-erythritol 2,4-cyclodiphosphate synthase [Candidatus Poribacteria bacterium]|nr:2-C-methyl-D-erythritol 2,4-cyclodiphosphate synthase [Candidatus Poribacteria bacterium]